jgi:stress response protein YsnF
MASTSRDGGNGRAGDGGVVTTVPVVEEQALVRKRRKVTGAVRVRTVVREAEEVVEEPFLVERVEVERVPVGRWVEGPVATRQEGDTTIIPVLEEVVVVERRLRLVEEVRVTKRRRAETASERVALRREEVVVERLDAAETAARSGGGTKQPRKRGEQA